MISGRSVIIIVVICAAAALALLLGTAEVYEDGLVSFRIEGKVFDKVTREPLNGVEVLLLLDEYIVNNKKELDDLFERYSSIWHEGLDPPEQLGISREDGEYITLGSRRYSRKYISVFGLGRPKEQPFRKAWIVFRKDGYKMDIVEVKTAGWKNAYISEDTVNTIKDKYLEKQL